MFQFTRPRGARRHQLHFASILYSFNSHAHVGRDRFQFQVDYRPPRFNSHARVGRDLYPRRSSSSAMFQFTHPRGARPCIFFNCSRSRCFNSHAHVGRDFAVIFTVWTEPFQFTRPRGARRREQCCFCTVSAFQFTRPRGARPPQCRRLY